VGFNKKTRIAAGVAVAAFFSAGIGAFAAGNGGGEPFWTVATVALALGGCLLLVIVLMLYLRDRALNELARQNRLLEALIEAIPAPIFYKDAQGRYLGCNENFSEYIGLPRDKVIGSTVYDVAPQELADKYKEADHALLNAGGHQVYEAAVQYADGSHHDVVFHKAVYEYAPGRPGGMVGVMLDVSQRKSLERDLIAKTEELERSNAELTQFASVISHDLRQPLNHVTGFLGLLQVQYGDQLDEKARDFIATAIDGAERMSQLIQSLLEYASLENFERETARIDLAEVFEDVVGDLAAPIRETEARIVFPDEWPTVVGSKSLLYQAFLNLVANAVKYRSPDRVPEVTVDVHAAEGEWVVSVSDNGMGIDAKSHDEIFKLFHRGQIHDSHDGTGIGLAVVKRIVEHHDGHVWLDSALGKGSTFHISLPKVE